MTSLARLVTAGSRVAASVIKSDSYDAATLHIDSSVDAVFIDACHKKEATYSDIMAWLPKIRDGGILAGHDYTYFASVREAVKLSGIRAEKRSTNCWFHQVE